MSMQPSDLVVADVALWAMRYRLTLQQAIFVEAYRHDFDPVKALRIAGFPGRNGKALAMKLLNQRNIQAALKARNEELHCRAEEMRAAVLKWTRDLLEADLDDIYDESNQLKPVAEWPEVWRKGLVRSLKVDAGADNSGRNRVKLSLADRLNFLELLMRHLGMLGPRIKRNEDRKLLGAARAAQMSADQVALRKL
ncbi:terminase small subunit [Sulfitobacter sp. R18_1]|uniref:terminase small subunit n=1 Tax=Sulfitobacter sp. R18_1 TaxID=2821104 RepID=UPI001ADA6D02|nr:terminase small subunit [Sulfitobacter sp. R18_1]MBO9432553.1 terminase small subunit [Sulfitobacter sp. R18_1]